MQKTKKQSGEPYCYCGNCKYCIDLTRTLGFLDRKARNGRVTCLLDDFRLETTKNWVHYLRDRELHALFEPATLWRLDYRALRRRQKVMKKALVRFRAMTMLGWLEYARTNWPEIDQYFDLKNVWHASSMEDR
jgi:hypothetical protein